MLPPLRVQTGLPTIQRNLPKEGVGFEPTDGAVSTVTQLATERFKPLSHPSVFTTETDPEPLPP